MHNTPTRRTSVVLFGYITREFAVPLVCCLAGFAALFLVADVFDVLQDLLEARAPFVRALQYFLLREPANLVNVLPMAVLLSASFVTGNLGRHHELTAIRTAGVSMVRGFLPVWLIAAALSAVSYWLTESVVPRATARSTALLEELTSAATKRPRQAVLAFRNAHGDRDWFFECFSVDGPQTGVLIKQFRPDERRLLWELRAKRATHRDGGWTLYDGIRVAYDAEGALPEGPEVPFQELREPSLVETPREILNSLRPAYELSVAEMRRLLAYHENLPRTTRDIFRTTIWQRVSYPLACVIGALLGVALAIIPERSSPLRGFAMAVGIMALYHVTSHFFVLLGKHGAVPPAVGGALPSVLFAAWGGMELYRRR